jgi:hypothetical protein
MPGKMSSVRPSPAKPGWPSAQASPAEIACTPAPSSECPLRWYQSVDCSGTPTYCIR